MIEGLLTGDPQTVFWIGIVLGFLLGVAIATLVHYWRNS